MWLGLCVLLSPGCSSFFTKHAAQKLMSSHWPHLKRQPQSSCLHLLQIMPGCFTAPSALNSRCSGGRAGISDVKGKVGECMHFVLFSIARNKWFGKWTDPADASWHKKHPEHKS